jgi:hypothetical protein
MIPAHVRFLTGTPCNAHSHSNHQIHARQVDFAAALSVKNIAVMSAGKRLWQQRPHQAAGEGGQRSLAASPPEASGHYNAGRLLLRNAEFALSSRAVALAFSSF